jgi:hypothetical protein
LIFIIGLALTRPFKLNEWLIGLTGIVTSFYFFASWLFITGKWRNFTLPEISVSYPVFLETRWAIVHFYSTNNCNAYGDIFYPVQYAKANCTNPEKLAIGLPLFPGCGLYPFFKCYP